MANVEYNWIESRKYEGNIIYTTDKQSDMYDRSSNPVKTVVFECTPEVSEAITFFTAREGGESKQNPGMMRHFFTPARAVKVYDDITSYNFKKYDMHADTGVENFSCNNCTILISKNERVEKLNSGREKRTTFYRLSAIVGDDFEEIKPANPFDNVTSDPASPTTDKEGFMSIPDGIDSESIFN